MNPTLKNILAFIAGAVACTAINMGIIQNEVIYNFYSANGVYMFEIKEEISK